MSRVVLDSSALLAVVNNEPGFEIVAETIGEAIISAVNHAEVVTKLVDRLGSLEIARKALGFADVEVLDFDRGLAEDAGALVRQTSVSGLSLGDRACLALAAREGAPVLTSDRTWSGVNIGVEVRLIR